MIRCLTIATVALLLPFSLLGQETQAQKILGCWTLADMSDSQPNQFSAGDRIAALDAVICYLPDGTFITTFPDNTRQTGHYGFEDNGKTLVQTRDNASEGSDEDARVLLLNDQHFYCRSGSVTIYLERQLPNARQARKIFFTLADAEIGTSVPYANVVNEGNIVASSDSIGVFSIDEKYIGRPFKISAIGYKTLTRALSEAERNIALEPDVKVLREVAVGRATGKRKTKLGSLTGRETNMYCSRQSQVSTAAQLFKTDAASVAQYIAKIRFDAFASEKGRTVSVYLCSVAPGGWPGAPLTDPVVCNLKKGNNIAEIDLSDSNITLPPEGLFLVFDRLNAEENRVYGVSQFDKTWYFCEPGLAVKKVVGSPNRWYFQDGVWRIDNHYSFCAQLILTD